MRKDKIRFVNDIEIDDIPASSLVQREKKDRFGQVEGLEAEELADPCELERQVYKEWLGPVLSLPNKYKGHGLRPEVNEQGVVDWGAFASIDFLRDNPGFMDKAKYKLVFLKEELRDQLIMMEIVRRKLSGKAYSLVLKYLEMDIISMDDVSDFWMKRLAMRYFKAKRLKEEIKQLREYLNSRAAPR